jgi:prophage regulatory protein
VAGPRAASTAPGPLLIVINTLDHGLTTVKGTNVVHVDLVGLTEIARLLGISRQRVDQLLRTDEAFPEPIATLSAGRIWERADIESWARATGRLQD